MYGNQIDVTSQKGNNKVRWLQFFMSLVFLALLLKLAPVDRWTQILPKVKHSWAIVSILLVIGLGILDTWRSEILLTALAKNRIKNFQITFVSSLIAQLPLGIVGGDVFRALAFRKNGVPIEMVAGAIGFCRLLGLLITLVTTIIIAIQMLIWSPHPMSLQIVDVLPLLALILMVFVFFSMVFKLIILSENWPNFFKRNRLKKLIGFVRQIPSKSVQAVASVSFSMLVIRIFILWCSAKAFDMNLGIGVVTLGLCLGFLISTVPISLAGIGLREGGIVGVLAFFGFDLSHAVIVAVAFRAFIISGTLLGIFLAFVITLPSRNRRRGT
jgi:uncharacterized protein (TIRG00374 family)